MPQCALPANERLKSHINGTFKGISATRPFDVHVTRPDLRVTRHTSIIRSLIE